MYSVFNEPAQQNRFHKINENNVKARKPGENLRKPFAERKNNVTATNSVKPKPIVEKKVEKDVWGIDFCSYKDVPDNYEDIYTSGLLYDDEQINDITRLFFGKLPKTPPVSKRIMVAEPELMSQSKFPDFGLDMADDIKFDAFDFNLAPMPDFD